jgi:hypothetical protein
VRDWHAKPTTRPVRHHQTGSLRVSGRALSNKVGRGNPPFSYPLADLPTAGRSKGCAPRSRPWPCRRQGGRHHGYLQQYHDCCSPIRAGVARPCLYRSPFPLGSRQPATSRCRSVLIARRDAGVADAGNVSPQGLEVLTRPQHRSRTNPDVTTLRVVTSNRTAGVDSDVMSPS